jgi:hypothetical protein
MSTAYYYTWMNKLALLRFLSSMDQSWSAPCQSGLPSVNSRLGLLSSWFGTCELPDRNGSTFWNIYTRIRTDSVYKCTCTQSTGSEQTCIYIYLNRRRQTYQAMSIHVAWVQRHPCVPGKEILHLAKLLQSFKAALSILRLENSECEFNAIIELFDW